jgi:hypothetical protein
MKNLQLLLFLCAALAFTACKKDDDPSKKEMLTNKNWVMTAATVDPSFVLITGGSTNNLYNQLEACAKDDITRLNADGKATFDEGALKCNVADPQTTNGTWALSLDEKTLSITDPASTPSTTSITILSLSSSKMMGTYQMEIGPVTYTVTATLEAK